MKITDIHTVSEIKNAWFLMKKVFHWLVLINMKLNFALPFCGNTKQAGPEARMETFKLTPLKKSTY